MTFDIDSLTIITTRRRSTSFYIILSLYYFNFFNITDPRLGIYYEYYNVYYNEFKVKSSSFSNRCEMFS